MNLLTGLGHLPGTEHFEKIKASPNYKNGQFVNLTPTPQLAHDSSWWKVMRDAVKKQPGKNPGVPITTHHYSIGDYAGLTPRITWFGHSSYLVQVAGRNILVDPVFSKRASFSKRIGPSAFAFDRPFSIDQLPSIDYVILTHDHYDHMDHATMLQLKNSVKHFYTPLGVGAHLLFWGIPEKNITELDWWQSVTIDSLFELVATPARHFSGRGLKRNQSLWTSYVFRSGHFNLYIGGDSGYDTHFSTIGEQYGPFDLVILENGQYNRHWPFIHMAPEETVQAAHDLKAKVLLPVHWARFSLSTHSWTEPAERVLQKAKQTSMPLTMPKIGEPVHVAHHYPFSEWWK